GSREPALERAGDLIACSSRSMHESTRTAKRTRDSSPLNRHAGVTGFGNPCGAGPPRLELVPPSGAVAHCATVAAAGADNRRSTPDVEPVLCENSAQVRSLDNLAHSTQPHGLVILEVRPKPAAVGNCESRAPC